MFPDIQFIYPIIGCFYLLADSKGSISKSTSQIGNSTAYHSLFDTIDSVIDVVTRPHTTTCLIQLIVSLMLVMIPNRIAYFVSKNKIDYKII